MARHGGLRDCAGELSMRTAQMGTDTRQLDLCIYNWSDCDRLRRDAISRDSLPVASADLSRSLRRGIGCLARPPNPRG